ncbi:hypothetical protein [Anaerotignum sp.]|uniref:hypothetical protein n=1 Tax=Anaerotignum sp. TaxID=2039241 RepID=UPI0028B1018F|nr:hypothetical protein [Anaerotignum sp.]
MHRQVIDMLEPMGRTKAQFIANAVLHYVHCPQTPDITQSVSSDYQMIEAMVWRIIEERLPEYLTQTPPKKLPKKVQKSEDVKFDDAASILGEDGMAAIIDTLSAFRAK